VAAVKGHEFASNPWMSCDDVIVRFGMSAWPQYGAESVGTGANSSVCIEKHSCMPLLNHVSKRETGLAVGRDWLVCAPLEIG